MANISKWSKVQVAIQSALGAAQAITGITKASPGVVTTSGTLPSTGSYVLVSAQGMSQVDARVFRVSGASGSTFALEGEDTTLYDTFTSGSFQVITFGTTAGSFVGLTASGGDFDFIDVTTIHDQVKKQIPGTANPASYSFESFWDPSDAALIALKAASDAQSQRAVRFTFAGGQVMAFTGYIGATMLPTGNAQDLVKTNVTVTAFGRPTVYAS